LKNPELLILCDLGGVLIDLNWHSQAEHLFGSGLDPEALKSRWLALESVKIFEAGQIDFAGFYELFCKETAYHSGVDAFVRDFTGILGPDKPGCVGVLERLSCAGRLAMLSNTNALHIETLKKSSKVFAPFDDLFFSYELGLVKPDPQIFAAVCRRTGCPADRVLFFDDSETNVAAATRFGMHAWRVDGPDAIEKIVDAWKFSAVL